MERDLKGLYEEHYSAGGDDALRYGAWRALGAKGKADHVVALARALPAVPRRVVEVGCGDGALLEELGRRRFGDVRDGFELSEAAARLAAGRAGVGEVRAFDGERLPVEDGAFDLAILSHVLEHVPDPARTLREAARAADAVILEVPLEDNRSARRASKRDHHEEIGHLHRFSRSSVRQFVDRAQLRVEADLADPLPREVHTFFAESAAQKAKAEVKAAVRRSAYTLAGARAERLFTVHYAALCLPRQ
jgi:SAM-dependent methyltransferase